MAKITRDNFTATGTKLIRATTGRSGTPNGNVYIDTVNDRIELIDTSEKATFGATANDLIAADGVQGLALYFFLMQEVDADPLLQNYLFGMDAVPNRMGKLVGAVAFLNGIKLATNGTGITDDRLKLVDTGFTEFAAAGGGNSLIDRVYHGIKSLNPINATSQGYYMLAASNSEADRLAATPVNFKQTGDINQVIQTFGSTANGDTAAGTTDNKASTLILCVRDFGYEIAETSSILTGVTELGAYAQGYGIGNPAVSELSTISKADVWGVNQIAPYTGLGFQRETTTVSHSGFNEAAGNFKDTITNTAGASLLQIRAWLDMLMQSDADENANTANTGVLRPKRMEPLYTINAAGKLVTRAGLYIANIPAADQQSVILTDDAGAQKTYPFNVGLVIKLSTAWFNDAGGQFFRLMYANGAGTADFDTANAVTATDANSVAVTGSKTDTRISPDGSDYKLSLSYAYDSNTEAGLTAATDKQMALLIGGGTTSKYRVVYFTITRTAQIIVDATTDAETN